MNKPIVPASPPTFRDAVRAAVLGTLDDVRSAAEGSTRGSAAADVLRAALVQRGGDVAQADRYLLRLEAQLVDEEHDLLLEFYVPLLISKGDLERAERLILAASPNDAGGRAGIAALASVIAALRGEFDVSATAAERAMETLTFSDDVFHRTTVLQRLSLASFYRYEYLAAMDLGLSAAKAAEGAGYPRYAAIAYTVPYSVAHSVLADPRLALYYAERTTISARQAGDDSFVRHGLASQAIVAAESGNPARLKSIARRIITARNAKQYREEFAVGLALALPLGWERQYEQFAAAITALREGRGPMERAHCDALLGFCAYVRGDVIEARKRTRSALHLTRPNTAIALHDDNNRRLARGIAAAVCMRIGDRVRAERALETKDMAATPQATLATGNYAAIVAGYGILFDVAAQEMRSVGSELDVILTPAQRMLLHELAAGKSIPEISREIGRSVTTLRTHAQQINERLGVSGRAAAITRARQLGLI
ncbi:MAG: hypothetical protein NVSMB64_07620 [Candidatus Velthaea sp.]